MEGGEVVIGNENALWSPTSSQNMIGGHIFKG